VIEIPSSHGRVGPDRPILTCQSFARANAERNVKALMAPGVAVIEPVEQLYNRFQHQARMMKLMVMAIQAVATLERESAEDEPHRLALPS